MRSRSKGPFCEHDWHDDNCPHCEVNCLQQQLSAQQAQLAYTPGGDCMTYEELAKEYGELADKYSAQQAQMDRMCEAVKEHNDWCNNMGCDGSAWDSMSPQDFVIHESDWLKAHPEGGEG